MNKWLRCGLFAGLIVCGSFARAFAQASGQSAVVVPRHTIPLPELPVAEEASIVMPVVDSVVVDHVEQPHRGIPTPKAIEAMMDAGEYAEAVDAFERYIKTAEGDSCDLIYLPFTFYSRLLWEDSTKPDFYQGKVDFYVDKFLQTCGNTVDAYILRDLRHEPRMPDSTVVWMTEAIQLDSNYNILYITRGEAFWQLQRIKEACADFKRAAVKDDYAKEFYEMNCLNQSEAEWESWEKNHPSDAVECYDTIPSRIGHDSIPDIPLPWRMSY